MGKGALLVGSLLLGAVGGFAAHLLTGASAAAPTPSGGPILVPSADAAALERLERRVDELAAGARPDPAAAPDPAPLAPDATAPGDTPAAETGPAMPPGDRLASLEARVTALERRGGMAGPVVPDDLTALPGKELLGLAMSLSGTKRHADEQRVLEELLRRGELDENARTKTELQLGYSLRAQGRHREAEARFRETQLRLGEDTEGGAAVGFQIGWERYYLQDRAGARAQMERVADTAEASAVVRVHALYNAANFARQDGDPVRAETLLRRLLEQHAGDIPDGQVNMKRQAQAWLDEIRGN